MLELRSVFGGHEDLGWDSVVSFAGTGIGMGVGVFRKMVVGSFVGICVRNLREHNVLQMHPEERNHDICGIVWENIEHPTEGEESHILGGKEYENECSIMLACAALSWLIS